MFFIVFLQTNKRRRASLRGRRKCWVRRRMLEILTSWRHAPVVVPSLTRIKQMLSAYGHTAEPARCHWRPITPSPRCDEAIQAQGHRMLSEQWMHRGWLRRHASHLSLCNPCARVGILPSVSSSCGREQSREHTAHYIWCWPSKSRAEKVDDAAEMTRKNRVLGVFRWASVPSVQKLWCKYFPTCRASFFL